MDRRVYPLRNDCALVLGSGVYFRLPNGREICLCSLADAQYFCAAARQLGEDHAAEQRRIERLDLMAAQAPISELTEAIQALLAKLSEHP